MNEEWRDIKGYEGKYQVSNLGRVKSLKDKYNNYREKILKPGNYRGYLYVNLCKEGKSKRFHVHRLVAIHFISNSNTYPQVNHKDENPSNNRVDNLEWCTTKYNINYGTHNKGFKNPKAHKVQCITTGKVFNCIQEASEYYYINRNCITACCVGRQKTGGKHPVTEEKLIWKYID